MSVTSAHQTVSPCRSMRWLVLCSRQSTKSVHDPLEQQVPDVPTEVQDVSVSRIPSTTTATSRTPASTPASAPRSKCPFGSYDGPRDQAAHPGPTMPHVLAQSMGVDLQRCMDLLSTMMQHNRAIPPCMPTMDILSLQVCIVLNAHHAHNIPQTHVLMCALWKPVAGAARGLAVPRLLMRSQASRSRPCATTCAASHETPCSSCSMCSLPTCSTCL